MFGQMMKMPLLISSLIDHANRNHGDTEIVSVNTDGGVTRKNWSSISQSSKNLAVALDKLGIDRDACCATLAWNNYRHLEIYFGVSGCGRICHTLNPRLFPEQLVYIFNHAQDSILFVDVTFLPAIAAIKNRLKHLKHIVLLSERNEDALTHIPDLLFYDELVEENVDDYDWPLIDENRASSLCYTSGTTGDPKGVLYSHRSTVLHCLASSLPDSLNLSARDSVMPVVPMFHVNAWGIPYAAAMVGARLVFPGPGLDGKSLVGLINSEGVTLALGVPTIWQGLLGELEKTNQTLPSLVRTVVGGAACPESMIETFREQYGVETIHAWGMTELSPIGTVNTLLLKHKSLPEKEQHSIRASQGRCLFGVEMRVVDDERNSLPRDNTSQGDLQCKGHWVVDRYFKADDSALEDGWFSTGDVSSIDSDGYMTIRDRSKDIIKSGGEWISTVELENVIVAHPNVAAAAVIAAKHKKWDERPVVLIVLKENQSVTESDILSFYENKIAKWQTPDRVIFVDKLPLNGTGKLMKNKLRDEYGDCLLANSET